MSQDRELTPLTFAAQHKTEPAPAFQAAAKFIPDLHPRKCVILMPVGGEIDPGCETALRKLEERGYAVWRVRGYAAIDQARNQMATDAMLAGFEETLWIDSDIVFRPEDVDRLRSHSAPVVCGIYPKKGKREVAVHILPGTEKFIFGEGGGLVEIRYAATGFLLVRKEVYTQVQEKCRLPVCNLSFGKPTVPYFMPMVHIDKTRGAWYLAEDFAFCERVRQSGYKIMADTSIRLWHVGTYGYSWEDAASGLKRFSRFDYNFAKSDGAANT